MMLLVSGATATLRRLMPLNRASLGYLVHPKNGNAPQSIAGTGMLWAADNGAFLGFDEAAYFRMLDRWAGQRNCLFITAPDVVGDAVATMALWAPWRLTLAAYGVANRALVAQDGLEDMPIPWEEFKVLFIGGTTRWKLSGAVLQLIERAQARHRWVHVGRVNTYRRLTRFLDAGVASVDGSSMSMWPDAHIPRFLRHIEAHKRQLRFCPGG